MNLDRAHGCDGKRRHANRRAANVAMIALLRDRKAKPGTVTVYRCTHCHGWHVGHLPVGARAPKTAAAVDAAVVRAWARDNNVDCPGFGKVPTRVLEAYRAATA